MNYNKLNINEVQFAFLASNRNISKNKGLVESVKANGVLQPITVINGSNVGIEHPLYDVKSNAEITQENKGDYYVVLDGQHRLTALMKVLKEKKEVSDADKVIPALIVTQEEVGDDVNKYIININSTSMNWKNGDYVKNATQTKPDDELIQAIAAFERRKFTMSTISRYICLNSSSISSKTLTEYVYSGKKISYADYKRAIRLYLFLIGKGLSDSFLKKRYMIDYIAEMKKQHNGIELVLNLINYLQKGAIDAINSLKASECNVTDVINEILHQNFNSVLKETDNDEEKQKIVAGKDYLAMITDEDVRKFIEQPVEKKPAKPSRPSKGNGKGQKGGQKNVQTESKEGELEKLQESVQSESQGKVQTQAKDEVSSKSQEDAQMVSESQEKVYAEQIPEKYRPKEQREDDSDTSEKS